MAEATSSSSEMDVEKAKNGSEDENIERGRQESVDTFNDDDVSSAFSESRHIEGPASLRSQSSTGLSRTTSRRLEQVNTTATNVLSTIRSRVPQRQFTHALVHEKTRPDVIVDFDGPDDPYRPINWLFKKKVITTLLYGLTTMTATFASAVFSTTIRQISQEFHVGEEVSNLGTSLFLFGLGLGPLVWAPLSELYGRKPAVLIPTFIAAIFAFGCGAGKDIQTIMICRFFQGFFGSAPVTNTGGVLGDIWSAEQRGTAIVGYVFEGRKPSLCLIHRCRHRQSRLPSSALPDIRDVSLPLI